MGDIIPILMADEVVVMTAKPKTGKAIMTDEEIINEYDECHIGIEEVIKIARQQGRADSEKERPKHFNIDYKKRYETVLKALAEAKKEVE